MEVSIMPRKSPDTVEEKRITLGQYERDALKRIERVQLINGTTNAFGNAVAGIGVIGLGAGVVFLGIAALNFIGADPLQKAKDFGKDIIQGTGRTVGDVVLAGDDIGGSKVRRDTFQFVSGVNITAVDAERAYRDATDRIQRFCTPGSKHFDEGECQRAKFDKTQARNVVIELKNSGELSGDDQRVDGLVRFLTNPFGFNPFVD